MSRPESVWLATATRPAFPRLDGDVEVDVAVVGGGITGLTTATLLHERGVRVAVVEANVLGGGTTGGTTGKVTSQHALTYHQLIERRGERVAVLYAAANQAAIGIVEDLVTKTDADCGFTRADAYVVAHTAEEARRLEAEHAAASHLGLPSALTDTTDLPFPVLAALRFDDQAHFHAGRYTAALARALAAGGAQLYEHTRALAIDERDGRAHVRTEHGVVRCERVVVATLLPFTDRGGFFAKVQPTRAYGIAARLRTPGPDGMHITAGDPIRSTRPWDDDGRPGLVVVGESHRTGDDAARPARWGALEEWAREHFDVESFEYRWSAQDYGGPDGVPYVGRSPRTSRTLVATGFRKWGLTNGTAAGAVLADLVEGREHEWLAAYDATRIGDAATVARLAKDNVGVGVRFVTDRLRRRHAEPAAALPPGAGGPVELDGETVGAYRAPDGTLHAVDLTCTHLGCSVRWNAAERSWDCPCHGSRFDLDGQVLEGPAVRNLARRGPGSD